MLFLKRRWKRLPFDKQVDFWYTFSEVMKMVRIHRIQVYIRFIALLLLLLILPAFGEASMFANAEDEVHTVYVSSAEVRGERDGSRERPYETLYDAFLALSNQPSNDEDTVSKSRSGGCIVVLDRVTVADAAKKNITVSLPDYENPITVTGEEGAEIIFMGASYYTSFLLGGKTIFDDILLRAENHVTILANGHDLTFTENFESDIQKGALYISGSNYGITRIYGGTFSTIWATDVAGCVPNEKEGIEPADSVLLFGKNATVTGMLFGAGATHSFSGSVLLILEGGNAGHVYGGGQNIPFYGDTQIWIAGNVSATVNGGGVGKNGKVEGKRYIYEMLSAPNSHYLPENFDVWMGVKETESTKTYSQGLLLKSYNLYRANADEKQEEDVIGLCALPIVNGKNVRLFRVDQDGLHRVFYTRIYGYFSFSATPGEYVLLETGELTGVEDIIPSVELEEDGRTPGEIITDTAMTDKESADSEKNMDDGLGVGWLILIILSVMTVVIGLGLFVFAKVYAGYHHE